MNKVFAFIVAFTPIGGLIAQDAPLAPSGTYQLLTIEPKVQEVFTTASLSAIEGARAEDHDVYLRLGRVTWVLVLARQTIASPGFQRLPEGIVPVSADAIPPYARTP